MALISNKVTEKDLRDYLTSLGFAGHSASFLKLELAAVKRPGWLQIFDFHVKARKCEGGWHEFFGILRSDEHNDTFEVQLFGSQEQHQLAMRDESMDLITHSREKRHWSLIPLMTLFLAVAGLAIAGAIVSSVSTTSQSAAVD